MKTEIEIVKDIPWGTHICQFYETKKDLIDILVPYFRKGLENNEFCMWITSKPLNFKEANEAMKKAMPDFDEYLNKGQIEIIPHNKWYLKDGILDTRRVLKGWVNKLNQALAKGYEGLRLTGNIFWLEKKHWGDFTAYEEEVNNVIGRYRMKAICTYCHKKCGASEIVDVVKNHQFALINRENKWDIIENSGQKESLRELNMRFLTLINAIPDIVFFKDTQGRHLIVNKANEEFLELSQEDIIGKTVEELLPPDIAEQCRKSDNEVLEMRKPFRSEEQAIGKGGSVIFLDTFKVPLYDKSGNAIGLIGIARDITERKRAEEALKQREKELETKSSNLEETNIALKVLLKKRDEDKTELEEKILLNVKELVVPYLEKLKKNRLDEKQEAYVGILESNLNDITSPFSHRLSSRYMNFTPTEIQVANLLRQGKTNKEIGELLNSSQRTIAFHRESIRKKLGLKNKKINLKTYLLSLT